MIDKYRFVSLAMYCVALAGCASAPSAPVTDKASLLPTQKVIAAGDQAFRQGEFDKALYAYATALEEGGPDAAVFFRLGVVHERLEQNPQAEAAFDKVLELQPEHVGALEQLGLLLAGRHANERAEKLFERALELDANRWRAHNALGILDDLRKDYAAAIEHYEAALALVPESAMLLNNRGYSRYLAGDLDGAARDFYAASQYDPEFRRARQNLGLVYARRGWYEDAIDTYTQVLEPAAAYNDVGYVAMLNGDHEAADEYLREAIRLSPTFYETARDNLAKNDRLWRRAGRASDNRQSSSAPSPAEAMSDTRPHITGTVKSIGLNVRGRDSAESEIIGFLQRGQKVQVVGDAPEWSYVEYQHESTGSTRRGWVKSSYLEIG
ncbi:MAG: tetratricopeptide repeat protein [Gammaproteobacteria bacterium]